MNLSNYPPGVTGNEPQITGEWPCDLCGGCGYEEDENGKNSCALCGGTGIHPEDAWELSEMRKMIEAFFKNNDWGEVDVGANIDGYLTIDTNLIVLESTVVKES